MSMRQCCLCSQIEGRAEDDLIARMLPQQPYARRVMLENSAFAVLPSIGPLVPGHSLVCPKAHIRSFAALQGELHSEYMDIKAKLCSRLRELYAGEIHIFEHGSAQTGTRVLCTVDHAHMHFVPLPRSFIDAVPDGAGWKTFDASRQSLQELTAGEEYAFYETPSGVSRLFVSENRPIESQYMSRLIATRLGQDATWNWRAAMDPRSADETWRRFMSAQAEA